MRLAALTALLAVLTAGPAAAEPPMWVVRDKDSEMVLFGSVHLLPPRLAWRPAGYDAAIGKADDVWFELTPGPEAEAEVTRLAGALGVLPPDQSLLRMLPPKDAERLMRVARAYGVDLAVLDRLQPWLADITMAGAVYRRAGAVSEAGVEAATQAQLPPGTARRAFETPTEQMALFADTPLADQIASLRETLKDIEDDPDQYQDLLKAWLDGDVATLKTEALDPLAKASPEIFRRLVTARNERWIAALRQRLDGSGRTVVVVGVGHLLGPGGVPARLRALGYSVEGP